MHTQARGRDTTGRTALLFQTHYFDRALARQFARLQRQLPDDFDAHVLVHLPPGAAVPHRLADVPHHIARTDELAVAAYPRKRFDTAAGLWAGGHVDLIVLHFTRAHPDYAQYWVVEYDVRYSGSWRRLFEDLRQQPADLLAPALRARSDDAAWAWWNGFAPAAPLAVDQQLCCFMPIFRVSRAGVAAVDAAWRAGWAGHSEAVWPSAIHAAGLVVAEPGGNGRFTPEALRGRHFSCAPTSLMLAPGTLLFKPPLYRMGSRRDMLWHPVKPFWWRAEFRQALQDIRIALGFGRRRLLARFGGAPRVTTP